MLVVSVLSILIISAKGDDSASRMARFNTVCGDQLKGLLGNQPNVRAGLIFGWIKENAQRQTSARLWYFDRKENRWRRHLFSKQALLRIATVPAPDPEIILRESGQEYRLQDFYFRNEIKLSAAEESAHLKDVSESIRRSYQYPDDAKASPFEASGTERALYHFMALSPDLVRELIQGDPERATRVIHEMIRAARRQFTDQADQSIARQMGVRGSVDQIGIEMRARKKFEELYAATGDSRLDPNKVFGEKNLSQMTMAGEGPALTVLQEKPAAIYRYRGLTGDNSLPRAPDVLDLQIRARLSLAEGAATEKFEWALLRDERTGDELKKLANRDRAAYEEAVIWIVSQIQKHGVNFDGLPTRDFVSA